MRPAMRFPLREARFVCLSCRFHVAPRVSPLSQFRGYASESPGVLERTRRMLWGTENPPGPEDPYSGSQIMTSPKAEYSDHAEEDFSLAQQQDSNLGDEVEIPDWTKMPKIGYLKEDEWSLRGPSRRDSVKQWYARKDVTPVDEALVRRAAVEVSILQFLRNLSMAGLRIPREVVEKCRIHGQAPNWCDRLRFPGEADVVGMFRQVNKTGGPEYADKKWTKLRQVLESQPIKKKNAQETFRSLSLANGAIKFAFFGRLSTLAGQRIPESIVASTFDVAKVVSEYESYVERTTKSTPQTLRMKMIENRLPQLANVKVSDFRQTSLHNDESLGRKKAILTALFERGLVNKPSLPGGTRRINPFAEKRLKKKKST